MAAMVGLGSFWMENLPPCTLVVALKVDQTHLVRETFNIVLDSMWHCSDAFSILPCSTFHLNSALKHIL